MLDRNTWSLLNTKRCPVWRYCNNLCLGISVMFFHFPLNIHTSQFLHTHSLTPHVIWHQAKPGSISLPLLSTSHLTEIFACYTAKKLKFQQEQRYNIMLLCCWVNTANIQWNVCVLFQGGNTILRNGEQAQSPVSECRMTMTV